MEIFILILNECPNDYEILRVIYFVLLIIKIILIIVPIGVILMTGLDLFKNVATSKEDDMKKNLNIAIKRIVYCVCVFFVPTIVNLVFSILGDIGVDYATYVSCANLEDINVVIKNKASKLVAQARDSLDYSDYTEAIDVVSDIKDDNIRQQYENELDSIKIAIDKNRPVIEDDQHTNPVKPGSGSDSLNVKYPDEMVENLAAFIGSEAGGYSEGFLGQLMTGAVYINNYHEYIGSIDDADIDSMCKMFAWTNPTAYTSNYCYYNFDKLVANRGTIPDEHFNQLTIVAKILLSKKFTIPKDVRFQAADWIINKYGTIWGVTYTGLDVEAYKWSYFGYGNDVTPLQGLDVYGNTVSVNFDDYKKISDDLYKKYVEK